MVQLNETPPAKRKRQDGQWFNDAVDDNDDDGAWRTTDARQWVGSVVRVPGAGVRESGWVVGWFGGGCIGVVPSVRRQEGKPLAESNLTNQYLGFKGIARPIIPD